MSCLRRSTLCALPLACIHLATLRRPYPNEAYLHKTQRVGDDHEPLYACGAMPGLSDVNGLLGLLDEIEALGLDAMCAGVALAWATEAQGADRSRWRMRTSRRLLARRTVTWPRCSAA